MTKHKNFYESEIFLHMEDILERLQILKWDDLHILAVHPVSGKAHYIYATDESMDCIFHFSLLCECREESRKLFSSWLKEVKLKPIATETATDYFETLTHK